MNGLKAGDRIWCEGRVVEEDGGLYFESASIPRWRLTEEIDKGFQAGLLCAARIARLVGEETADNLQGKSLLEIALRIERRIRAIATENN